MPRLAAQFLVDIVVKARSRCRQTDLFGWAPYHVQSIWFSDVTFEWNVGIWLWPGRSTQYLGQDTS
jgi:hypothetical protein